MTWQMYGPASLGAIVTWLILLRQVAMVYVHSTVLLIMIWPPAL